MFTWDYRFVNTPSENDGSDWITLKEVTYSDEDGLTPTGFAEPCIGADNIDDVLWLTDRWAEAANKPVLHEDQFKQEMSYKYITIQAKPAPLNEVLDDNSDYTKGVARELALAESAPAMAERIIHLEWLVNTYRNDNEAAE